MMNIIEILEWYCYDCCLLRIFLNRITPKCTEFFNFLTIKSNML